MTKYFVSLYVAVFTPIVLQFCDVWSPNRNLYPIDHFLYCTITFIIISVFVHRILHGRIKETFNLDIKRYETLQTDRRDKVIRLIGLHAIAEKALDTDKIGVDNYLKYLYRLEGEIENRPKYPVRKEVTEYFTFWLWYSQLVIVLWILSNVLR